MFFIWWCLPCFLGNRIGRAPSLPGEVMKAMRMDMQSLDSRRQVGEPVSTIAGCAELLFQVHPSVAIRWQQGLCLKVTWKFCGAEVMHNWISWSGWLPAAIDPSALHALGWGV